MELSNAVVGFMVGSLLVPPSVKICHQMSHRVGHAGIHSSPLNEGTNIDHPHFGTVVGEGMGWGWQQHMDNIKQEWKKLFLSQDRCKCCTLDEQEKMGGKR